MRSLILCQACNRHVKASETQCPFCSAAVVLPRAPVAVRARGLPGGRAALFLAGTSLAPGCVEEPEPDEMVIPVYGAAIDPQRDAGAADAGAGDAGKDAGVGISPAYGIAVDGGFVVPPYGIAIPPLRDAGVAETGCPQLGNLPAPVYGVAVDSGPPSDACKDAGQDAGKDAGQDAGKDSGPMAVPVYGIAIDTGKRRAAPAKG
jgi:hypothetical protein